MTKLDFVFAGISYFLVVGAILLFGEPLVDALILALVGCTVWNAVFIGLDRLARRKREPVK